MDSTIHVKKPDNFRDSKVGTYTFLWLRYTNLHGAQKYHIYTCGSGFEVDCANFKSVHVSNNSLQPTRAPTLAAECWAYNKLLIGVAYTFTRSQATWH